MFCDSTCSKVHDFNIDVLIPARKTGSGIGRPWVLLYSKKRVERHAFVSSSHSHKNHQVVLTRRPSSEPRIDAPSGVAEPQVCTIANVAKHGSKLPRPCSICSKLLSLTGIVSGDSWALKHLQLWCLLFRERWNLHRYRVLLFLSFQTCTITVFGD